VDSLEVFLVCLSEFWSNLGSRLDRGCFLSSFESVLLVCHIVHGISAKELAILEECVDWDCLYGDAHNYVEPEDGRFEHLRVNALVVG